MKKMFIVLAVASLAIGCKGKAKSSWSKEEKDSFTTNCVNGATAGMGADKAKSYCDCMLGKIEEKYPKAAEAGNLDVNSMTEMAKDCLK
jgi:hypothetical protein